MYHRSSARIRMLCYNCVPVPAYGTYIRCVSVSIPPLVTIAVTYEVSVIPAPSVRPWEERHSRTSQCGLLAESDIIRPQLPLRHWRARVSTVRPARRAAAPAYRLPWAPATFCIWSPCFSNFQKTTTFFQTHCFFATTTHTTQRRTLENTLDALTRKRALWAHSTREALFSLI